MSPQPSLRLLCTHSSELLAKLNRRLPPGERLEVRKEASIAGQLLDTETDALWRSGILLVRTKHQLLALTRLRTLLLDVGDRPTAFVGDIEPGALREVVGKAPKLRRLTPRLPLTLKPSSATLADKQGGSQLRIEALTLQHSGGHSHLLDIYTADKHGEALDRISSVLQELGAVACSQHGATSPLDWPAAALAGYRGTGYVANPGVALQPYMSVKTATTTMIATYLSVARHNEAGVISDLDTEYLHDYRVSLRRVRSIISLFKGTYQAEEQRALSARLAELMRKTNRLRDLDVYLLEQQQDFDALPPSLHPGLCEVFAAFSAEREAEWQQVAQHLKSRAYRVEMRALQRAFTREEHLSTGPKASKNARARSASLITRRYRKVCSIAASIDSSTPDHRVHELRLQCKKLRYLLDLSGPLFGARQVRKIVKALKRLQDNLGRFNDYSVQQIALQRFLDQRLQDNSATSAQMVEAVGALIAIKHQLQIKERALVMKNFAEFHTPATDTLFGESFAAHDDPAAAERN